MDSFFSGGNAYYRSSHRFTPHNVYADTRDLYAAARDEMGWELEPEKPGSAPDGRRACRPDGLCFPPRSQEAEDRLQLQLGTPRHLFGFQPRL